MLVSVGDRSFRVRGRLVRIAHLYGEKYLFLRDPGPVVEGLRRCGMRIDLFTFLQKLPDTERKYPFPVEWDNLAVLPVSTFEYWWNKQIRFAPRGRIRRAEKKGVIVREVPFNDDLVRNIWTIYNECPTRQGRRFPHFGKDIATVRKEEATFLDNSIFIGAFFDGRMIGFVKLVHDDFREQANLMNIMSLLSQRDKCPTNALIAQAVRSCAERGIRFLVYQKFTYPNRRPDGLTQFKEVNGFRQVDVPRYYVPLTAFGRIAFRLGLHRRLVDRLPEPIAAKAREWRTSWYSRRFRQATEASRG